jgi:L-alanine-DL-glutamate epimerase-like enolase superfamily enzyme
MAATVHVAAAMGGSMPVEVAEGALEAPIYTPVITVKDGFVEPPSGPGLGIKLNEEALRRYPYSAAAAQPFLLR